MALRATVFDSFDRTRLFTLHALRHVSYWTAHSTWNLLRS